MFKPFAALALWAGCLVAGAQPVSDNGPHSPQHSTQHSPPGAPPCAGTSLACASVVTPFVDARGTLWLAWSAGGVVSVAHSGDGGRRFSPAVQVGQPGAALDGGADARPQIVVDAKGRVTVAYSVFKDKQYNAQVLMATSLDEGASFTAPHPLSQDPASQRFPALALDGQGALFVTWLDKRLAASAKKSGQAQPGAAVAYAWSRDGGMTFGPERIAQARTCECCRIAVALDPQRRPVVVFRNIFGERERDHAVFTLNAAGEAGPVYRVAADQWAIDGCPHHGPAVAVSSDGSYHVAWFTQGRARQGLFYARATEGGRRFGPPQAVGEADQQAGRPALLTQGQTVWLAWKVFDGQRIRIRVRQSVDAGRTWLPDRTVAQTSGPGDHPMLISLGGQPYLSWMTRQEGHRLLPLADAPGKAADPSASPLVITPQPLRQDSFAQIRASHAGQPLVVHIWGVSCSACLSELPRWRALLGQRPGMKVVLIQADEAPGAASAQMIAKAGLQGVPQWTATAELDEYLRASIDPQWMGELPRTLLIAPHGEITRIQGVADVEQVKRWWDKWGKLAGPGLKSAL